MFDREYWEERYRGDRHGAGVPNPQLVAEAGELRPGTALDAGCGEGAEAGWLAGRGWRVTAVDLVTTALDRAREHAATLGAQVADRIDWVSADLTEWVPPEGHFDLVTTHYVHPAGSPGEMFRRLAAAVAPGGTLLLVDHDPADHAAHAHHTVAELAAVLDPERWEVVVAETRTRTAVSVEHGGGREVTLHDSVLRARRRT